ncbi:hypothetical protein EA187_00395 [Lujinxingia sediminis]|uniref:DUF115 domain-containing protein n=1 Tax=Lujinxingia sediminis TaxID=2480984 RepID=A0ABY0CWX6_9DELT|nr:hypothetical protein [Lujinxingia sediminis]RVU47930.1 hypothetical protein EA187_00395 [Lujinxingia sediminis]
MSDPRSKDQLPWPRLIERLERSQQRLEAAHTDYLESAAASQRALTRVLESHAELVDTIRQFASVEQPSEASAAPKPPGEPIPPEEEATTEAIAPAAHSPHVAVSPTTGALSDTELPARTSVPPLPSPASSSSGAVARHITTPTLSVVEAPGQPLPALKRGQRALITNDGFGVAPLLAELLNARGVRARVEGRRPDLHGPTDVVIFLGSLRAPAHLDDAMSVVEDALITAERFTTRLMQPGAGFVAVLDSAGAFGLEPFDPVVAPYGATVGLSRALRLRHRAANIKVIDLNAEGRDTRTIAQHLATELFEGGERSPVALGPSGRREVRWEPFANRATPAPWLDDTGAPLIYVPGPGAVLATAVERLAIAHELPVAVLNRPGVSSQLARRMAERGVALRSADYDLERLFPTMDFLDALRADHGPIAAIVAEPFPARRPDDVLRWDATRPALDEFNALLAMTINDPLNLLAVGLGPGTPAVVASAIRYFARAESLRRNERLQVRLVHLDGAGAPTHGDLGPRDFALTELLSADEPAMAEVRFERTSSRPGMQR